MADIDTKRQNALPTGAATELKQIETLAEIDSYTILIEYIGNNPIYIGEAVSGSLSSTTVWRIKKITYSVNNPTKIEWANGTTNFDKEYDERATYTYS